MTAERDVEALKRELAREHERVRSLRDISTAVGSTLDLNGLLDVVLARVSELLAADRATLYVVDEDSGDLWARIRGTDSDEVDVRLAIGQGLAGWCAAHGELVNIHDAYGDVRFSRLWDEKTGYRTKSVLCVPLKNPTGRLVGVLQALNKRAGAFDAEDEALLEALGAQVAVAIENSKLFLSVVGKNMELLEAKEQLEAKVRELDVLFEMANVAATARGMDDVLRGALLGAMRAFDAGGVTVLLEGEGQSEVRVRLAAEPEERSVTVPQGEGLAGWVAQHGIPQRIAEVQRHPKYSIDFGARLGYRPKTALSVPLAWEGGRGALTLFDKARGRDPFDDGDVRLVSVIAGQLSTAIGLEQARVLRAREERLSAIGQFMSGVLHDLRTPMTVIGGYVKLLLDETDAEKRQRYADAVDAQLAFIKSMTQETLAFARGDRKLWVRKVYLHQFFPELVAQVGRELEPRGVAVRLALEDRGVAFFDPGKVQRAVHNLARNAAEAIGGRGGTVTVRVARRAEDGAVLVEVADDGPGISPEVQGRLFQSFATYGKEGGTGLGLAIVRSIAEDHGGAVAVASRPGETTFSVSLPQQPGAAADEDAAAAPQGAEGAGQT